MKTLQVFLSHTSDMARFPEDRPFVQAALDAVGRARMAPVDMRYFAARDARPADYCRQQVLTCDVYVAVIGFRYGSIVNGEGVSYTELEFSTASGAGLPRLVFLLAEAACPPALADADRGPVERFRKRLSEAGLLVREIGPDDSLELEIYQALIELAGQGTQHASRVRQLLCRSYISALAEPITPAGDMPAGLKIPTLKAGYIDHRIRAKEVDAASSEPGRESWWADEPINDSARHFLSENVTSPRAKTAPLVLLGQPGSGKSVLTRILAAQFSTPGFLPVRVELRQADVGERLQGQIESAIRDAIGEPVQWPEVANSGGRVLPVIIFDGFDELLQAAGVVRDKFLNRVQEFQAQEALAGRPLAVIVTSRTVVADRVRFPGGTTAIRLEPFDERQISAWLRIWGETNRVSLAERGMRPLPVDVALSYRELAEQPLLLLMLALYHADANGLQRRSAVLGQTELYGRLLKDFASREIRKQEPALPEDALNDAVEDELFRLSVVAFAMFNRRTQWVTEADLNVDFSTLLIDKGLHEPRSDRSQFELTPAQSALGRFFFVHEARATHERRPLRTYEFLHATFGEYLVALLVVRILTGTQKDEPDSGMLHALLSSAALAARSPIIAFIGDLFDQLDRPQRADITEKLLRLHKLALFRQDVSAYSRYEPLKVTVITRHAAWSANLVVLAVLADGEITGDQLFPQDPDPQLAWRSEALIWRSQLGGYGWEGLHDAIAFHRMWDDRRKIFRLTRREGKVISEALDISWNFDLRPDVRESAEIFSWPGHNSQVAQRKINFSSNYSEDFMAHDLAPLVSAFPATANVFVRLDDGRVVSALHVLIAALCAPYQEGGLEESPYLDLAQASRKLIEMSNVAQNAPFLEMALSILISAVGQGVVSPESVRPIIGLSGKLAGQNAMLTESVATLGRLLAGKGHAGPD
jgi:hypothetical protein